MQGNVRTYALSLLVAAVACAALVTVTQPIGEIGTEAIGVLAALTLALVVAAGMPMQPAGAAEHSVTLEEAVLLAMLVVVPVGALPWLVMLAVTLHEVRRSRVLDKFAFNVGMSGLGACAAVAVVVILREAIGEVDFLLALGLAAFGVVAAATTHLVVFAILQRIRLGGSVREHLGFAGYLDVALVLNVLLGVVLAAAIANESWMSAVAVALVVGLGSVLRTPSTTP